MVQKLLRLARHGVGIYYIPGNHDEALKSYFDSSFGNVKLKRDYVHVAADGKHSSTSPREISPRRPESEAMP